MKTDISKSTTIAKATTRAASLAALIMIAAILAIGAVALSGCSVATPSKSAETFMKALKSGDEETLKTVYSGNSVISEGIAGNIIGSNTAVESALRDQIQKQLSTELKSFDYTIGSEKTDGQTATVDVTITTYNLASVMTNFVSKYMQQALPLAMGGASQEQLTELSSQIFSSELSNAQKNYTRTIPLKLTQKNAKWLVDDIKNQQDFLDALSGGLLSSVDSYSKAASTSSSSTTSGQ